LEQIKREELNLYNEYEIAKRLSKSCRVNGKAIFDPCTESFVFISKDELDRETIPF
jgi:hypothetical protein